MDCGKGKTASQAAGVSTQISKKDLFVQRSFPLKIIFI